jgi:peptidoglycan/xylan/chitin deacetylase (PgdA/CDA1 family)
MEKLLLLLTLSCLFLISCVVNPAIRGSRSDTNTATKNAKLCALTFDDGPDSKLTPLVLDRLEKYDVVASFFVVGRLINENTKPVLERALKLGCEFNNHSWTYDGLDTMTAEQIRDSVEKTTAAIEEYTGTSPKFFRPPNLAVSDMMYETIDLPFAGGVVGYDWAACNTSAKERAQNVLDNIRDGAIILLHDVQPLPHPTPEALDILIPELKKRGYTFVTVSELFAQKEVTPKPNQKKLWVYVN